MLLIAGGEFVLFDFKSTETSGKWYIVNDDVMGGISKSSFAINADGTATFSGILSPDNNGGFASVRAEFENRSESSFKGVIVRLKGDGNIYSLRFKTNRNFDGYAYQAKMPTEKNMWKEFKIPFKDFKPTYRGRTLSNKPELESQNLAQIGLMIADKQFGEFTVDIDWIKFYY
jgi:hypothetical protein